MSSLPARVDWLDQGGYIPIISTFTGATRVGYGLWKFLAGGFEAGGAVCIEDRNLHYKQHSYAVLYKHPEGYAQKCSYKGAEAAADGIAHIFRGCIEIVPVVGNSLIYLYDSNQNDF